MEGIESSYRYHHREKNRLGFSLLEAERGSLFARFIGTGKEVLDLGCRDGVLTRHFASGNHILGVDVDSDALHNAASSLGIDTMRFDFNAETWPLKPQSFDVVVAAEVLEHLYHPERVLMRIQNMLRPGGMLIGSVPNAFTLKCRLKYLVASKRGTPLADAMHINQFGWNEFGQLMGRHFADVSLFPLGKPRGGLRDAIPSLFSYGIAFKALQLR